MALSISGTTNRQIPWGFQDSHRTNTRQIGPDIDERAPQYSRGTEVTTGEDEAETSLQHAWAELAHCRTTTAVGWRDCRTRESSAAAARKEAAEHETQDLHEHHYRVTTSPQCRSSFYLLSILHQHCDGGCASTSFVSPFWRNCIVYVLLLYCYERWR